MNRFTNTISSRLSLRSPQRESLEILADICEQIDFTKDNDTAEALRIIKNAYPNVTDFERDFPSLCFALATGVGKTRLMGAFIAYLNQAKGIKHFFVLAPNLTIYNKLIKDFQPNYEKYVLKGIDTFTQEPPEIITGDNYESGRGIRAADLFGETGVHINIFNISKINSEVRGGKAPRIKRLSEYIGESYFNYLAGLKDLVLIMDESHRYRGSAGINAINELNPILGLELTATPQIEKGVNTTPFKNIIYSYPLSKALDDGFVKEPTVATRENFNPANYSSEELEKIKLEDGVRIHESTKVDLETYSKQNDLQMVKPFMLIVARDTVHAETLMQKIKADDFFGGHYKNKVITVHSNQRGEESDETVQRLLAIENPKEETEIVVHVNMLKEGWDVTNLYTIVPLRAANSKTLVEQSIGRGLRLPFGKRTGEKAVDRLTIVAHDKFQEIVDEANKPDSVLKVIPVYIGKDIDIAEKRTVTVAPSLVTALFGEQPTATQEENNESLQPVQQKIVFEKQIDREIAQTTLEVIQKFERLKSSEELKTPEIQAQIVQAVKQNSPVPVQASFDEIIEPPDYQKIVETVTNKFVEMTIDIPKIVIVPKGESVWFYKDFDLDTRNINLQPIAHNILLQSLQTNKQERLANLQNGQKELVIENYLVKKLIDFDDISYDDHSDLLYKLSGRLISHLRTYMPDETAVCDTVQFEADRISKMIYAQMQSHQSQNVTEYEATVTKGFTTLRNNTYAVQASEILRDFRTPVVNKQDIRKMHFGGFEKCLYPVQKFESDTERRFAMILEQETDVRKWFKPMIGQFKIFYQNDAQYLPDFVVETADLKLLCEIKKASDIEDATVSAKSNAAKRWCEYASNHEQKINGKNWGYVLIPHDEVLLNQSLQGLISRFGK
jgi:type III restriction enzyme